MKAVSLKIKNSRITRSAANEKLDARILNTLLVSIGLLAMLYVAILGNMVFNIVERKALDVTARTLSNDVGDMELDYLTLSNKVDLTLGHSLGFKEARATYATRTSVGSLNDLKSSRNDL